MNYHDDSYYLAVECKILYRVLLLFKIKGRTLLLNKVYPKRHFLSPKNLYVFISEHIIKTRLFIHTFKFCQEIS